MIFKSTNKKKKKSGRIKNVQKIIIDGYNFASRTEGYYYTLLKAQQQRGLIKSFVMQIRYELQPQYRKCSRAGCDFLWIKPDKPDKRYKDIRNCPKCGALLELFRSLTYISDFDVTYIDGSVHVIDVKSSPFFQTDEFKLKQKIFEFRYPDKRLEMAFPKIPKGWNYLTVKDEML